MFEAVLKDSDGTLVDTVPDLGESEPPVARRRRPRRQAACHAVPLHFAKGTAAALLPGLTLTPPDPHYERLPIAFWKFTNNVLQVRQPACSTVISL